MKLPAACLLLAACAAPSVPTADVRAVLRPETTTVNRWYPSNKPPLAPSAFVKLPVGAIEARGWLREELVMQSRGFHGHLGEISRFLKKEGNAWLSPTGEGDHGWEEVPYWLKGFGDCAYLLGDEARIRETRSWIDAVLASQREDGFFGPRGKGAASTVSSTEGEWDLWPNMVMLDVLKSWYEFSGDERVLPALARYFRWELTLPDDKFVPPYWQHVRAYDNLWSAYWLYNRTDDPALARDLLALGEKIHRCAARWEDGVIDWHNVNVCQGFGGATFFSLQSHDERQRGSAERNFREFREKYGQVPGGLFGSDENARPGYVDPRQAIETCGMVEFMHSCERLVLTTGDTVWADRCEDVAFNSFPAALTADLRALRYLTSPNMATSDRTSHSPGLANGGPMYCFDPNDHRCCQHNFGHGWPYLAENLWLATADDGLCSMIPLASAVRAKVGSSGREVRVECETEYPFDTSFVYTVHGEGVTRFPLYVRVPGWAKSVSLSLEAAWNGELSDGDGFRPLLRIEREWRDGERVHVAFGAEVEVRRWSGNHDSASIVRGPLTYSLAIPTRTQRSGGTDAWPAFELEPNGPWNYALVLDDRGAAKTELAPSSLPAKHPVWTPENVPLRMTTSARRLLQWQLDEWALVAPLQASPARTTEPIERVSLIPMGAARLRISAFPVAGDGADAHAWVEPPKPPHPGWRIAASHCFEPDSTFACIDGREPSSSNDTSIVRHTFWPHKGTNEWLECTFDAPFDVRSASVYWFDDSGSGGCAVPAKWRVLARDEQGAWREPANARYEVPARDRWCRVEFDAVRATALKLEVELQAEKSGGVLEWRIE
jgi:hypothetical protein